MKILANVGCVLLIYGCVQAIRDRVSGKEGSSASTSFDWMFLWLLLAVAVTGLVTEVFRFVVESGDGGAAAAGVHSGLESIAYAVYFVHLVLVFHLLVYLPFSKFAHILYRTVALVYAEHTGRNQESMQAVPARAVAGPRSDQAVGEVQAVS
jgi:quinone-modifying oxidoreductase subunit QmoC